MQVAEAMVGKHVMLEDETSELKVRVEAPTLFELYEEAGLALAELMGGGGPPPEDAPTELVEVSGRDREALMVAWLNELIYLAETRGRVFTEVRLILLAEFALAANVRGRPVGEEGVRTYVKAATFHGLKVEEGPEGAAATIVLDV